MPSSTQNCQHAMRDIRGLSDYEAQQAGYDYRCYCGQRFTLEQLVRLHPDQRSPEMGFRGGLLQ